MSAERRFEGRGRPSHRPWTQCDVPAQGGKVALVTGTGGLGYQTAAVLAGAGAQVILAGRNAQKGALAVAAIEALHPHSQIRFETVDLASLASVSDLAESLQQKLSRLDLLINNAGVMSPPVRQLTDDGFELQFGTNYLAHFALTARLLGLLQRARKPRLVNISSSLHHIGNINFDNLQSERRYVAALAYGASKLAMLMFSIEFARRAEVHQWGIAAMAAHPGYARTQLQANGPGPNALSTRLSRLAFEGWASQSASDGALPTLYAATDVAAQSGAYYGPSCLLGLRGPPAPAKVGRRARNAALRARLWEVSEQLVGLRLGPATLTGRPSSID